MVTIWFALAALLTGVVAYRVGGVAVQLTVFSISSLILFSAGWFWLRKSMRMNAGVRHANESVVGEAATVVSPNVGEPAIGKVRFQVPVRGDDVWEFISDERLGQGDRCEVTEVVGSRVRVKKS